MLIMIAFGIEWWKCRAPESQIIPGFLRARIYEKLDKSEGMRGSNCCRLLYDFGMPIAACSNSQRTDLPLATEKFAAS